MATFEAGDLKFDSDTRSWSRGEQRGTLPKRLSDFLLRFIEQPNETIKKQEEDSRFAKNLQHLREALGDKDAKLFVTITGVGALLGSPNNCSQQEVLHRYDIAFERQFNRALANLIGLQLLSAAGQTPEEKNDIAERTWARN